MEHLFRFSVLREPNKSNDEIDPIDLTANTVFQNTAAGFPKGANRRNQLKAHAKEFIGTNSFVFDIASDPLYAVLERAAIAVEALVEAGNADRADVRTALETALGEDPQATISGQSESGKIGNLKDSILAIKLSPEDHHRPLRRLAAVLRSYELISRFVADEAFPADPRALANAQRRVFRLPGAVLPTKPPRTRRPKQRDLMAELKELAEKHQRISGAIRELRSVKPSDFSVTTLKKSPARLPPEKFRPFSLFESEWGIRQATLRATLLASVADVTGEPTRQPGNATVGDLAQIQAAVPFLTSDNLVARKPGFELGAGARIALMGRPPFEPMQEGVLGLRLTKERQNKLRNTTVAVLMEMDLDLGEPVARSIGVLTAERRRFYEASQALIQSVAQKSFKRIGNTTVAISSSAFPAIYAMSPANMLVQIPPLFFFPVTAGAPTTHADIKPTGILDLLIVRQQLKGYESTEVSHIANILKGEKKDRIHRTRLETEQITFTETETERTTENSLETTDRFEMRRTSEEALQEETAVKGSLSVSGKYGPTVEFRASGEASWQRRSQESESAANKVAREVTQKASEILTDRVLRRETLRVTRETEETNQHVFDNTAGSGHISGVYQWVTKVYEAQVFNYGPRTVYDIMIPEPGTFLLEVFRRRRTAAVELEKPPAFEITPDQLNEDNYQTYLTLYGATDVKPPPQPFVIESYDFNTGGEDKDQEFTNSTRIAIPDGYEAVRASVGKVVAVWDEWSVDVIMGQRSFRFDGGEYVWLTSLDRETGSVPFAMVTDRVGDVAIAVEIVCAATERADDLWRADTHAKLTNAYRARLAEYEAKLAELEFEAPPEIESGPASRNRAIMIDEIKKACVSVLTEQHFEVFDAINTDGAGLPRIDFNEAEVEGAYVRFFEQAFEWENLSWVAYSYFWGRKSTWIDKVVIEDDDAEFEAFLKAGYVRVQIPVRPGFVDAMDHFRIFGEPWQGGSLPAISDDTYLPIAEELAERLGRPGDEVAVGDPWEVRVPTTLVKLRADDKLPRWEKQPDGTWSEAT